MRFGLAAIVLCGCGRVGFDQAEPSGFLRPDATSALTLDGDPSVDAASGTGSYTVTQGTTPYVGLDTPVQVPGSAPGDDEQSYVVSIPFSFDYYGVSYTSVTVSVNGYVTFSTPPSGSGSFTNECPFDAAAPDAMIAVFWDDLYILPDGAISYQLAGSAPDRRLEVEWRGLDGWYQQGNMYLWQQGMSVTHKLVLHETGVIELSYGPRTVPAWNRDCGLDRHRGCSATVGLTGPNHTPIQPVQCGTASGPMAGYAPIDEGRLITFTPR